MVYLLKCTTGPCLCKLFQTFVKSCFPAIFCASYIGVEKYLKIDNTTRLKILYLKVWRLKRGSWFSSSCINSLKFYHLHFWNHTSFLLSSVKALQSCRGSIKNVKWKMKDGRLKLYIEITILDGLDGWLWYWEMKNVQMEGKKAYAMGIRGKFSNWRTCFESLNSPKQYL